MFCSICQKSYKLRSNYEMHLKTRHHRTLEKKYNSNPGEFRAHVSKVFISRFVASIANIKDYVEIGIAYQRFIEHSNYRLKGTCYKALLDCIADLEGRVDVLKINNMYYVKMHSVSIHRNRLKLIELLGSRYLYQKNIGTD